MNIYHLRVTVPNALTLFTLSLLVSVLVLIYCKRNNCWYYLRDSYARVQQNVFKETFIAAFLQHNSSTCSFPRPMAYLITGLLDTQAGSGIGCFSWNVPSFESDKGWLFSHISCHYCTKVSCIRITVMSSRACRWVCTHFPPLAACRIPLRIGKTSQQW